MGFKFKRVDLTAGSSDWPTGTLDENVLARSETVVKRCAQAIIDCNCGWQLDTSKNATINNTVDIPSTASGSTFPGLFLTNSSGCKLFIAYFGSSTDYSIADFSGDGTSNFRFKETAIDSCSCGLCMSMIPAGSSNTFGDPTTTSFIPADATRVIGTVNYVSDSYYYTFGSNPSSGYIYSWGLFVTPYCVAVSCAKSQNVPGQFRTPAYAVGRIFDALVHSTDTSNQAKYGVINFRKCDTTTDSEGIYDVTRYSTYRFGLNKYTLGIDPAYNGDYIDGALNVSGAFCKVNGDWVNGSDQDTYNVIFYPVDVFQTGGLIFNSTGNGMSRWCAYAMAVLSFDLATNGVVSGDGLKGYLDTSLFRCGLGTYGQLFNSGSFICVDSDNDLILGWDSTNTDQISG